MQIGLLLLIPMAAGLLSWLVRGWAARSTLLIGAATLHAGLCLGYWIRPDLPAPQAWLGIDALSLLFLSVTSGLFLVVAVTCVGYLKRESHHQVNMEEGGVFSNTPEARFVGCLLLFLAAMTLVLVSRHLGLLWMAVEATTLASAPLIGFHRHHRSLEATWKYLLICSVGIALALLGNFFWVVAASRGIDPASGDIHLTITSLKTHAADLDVTWLKAGFLLCLVGYGTKMGLVPLHTWLPDAHSEAPSTVSALLSGTLLNCAFMGILRSHSIMVAADLGSFSGDLLMGFGVISLVVAALLMIVQTDYKRLLAYSSVEHMGILALGVGLAGMAGYGAMLHTVNHAVTKTLLFLCAGHILAACHSKEIRAAGGLSQRLPVTAAFWLIGVLAITGLPPFGLFLSELTILKGAIQSGHQILAVLYLLGLGVVFIVMLRMVLTMVFGPGPESTLPTREPIHAIVPLTILGMVTLLLGLVIPAGLDRVLHQAVTCWGMP